MNDSFSTSTEPTAGAQALYFPVTRLEIDGHGYADGEVCLEKGTLRMDIPDLPPQILNRTPAEIAAERRQKRKSRRFWNKKKTDSAAQTPAEPIKLKTIRIGVKEIQRLSFIHGLFHPCRGFRVDCARYGAVKFFFHGRREERTAEFLVQTLLQDSGLTFDPKQSPNPARMQVWGRTARQAAKKK